MKPALIIGSTCVDIIINLDHLPVTAEDLHPTSQTISLGGCAFNVAYMMRLLHAPHTFISPVGSGMYGDYVAGQLAAMGIPAAIRVPDRDNGCCYCLVEASGERTFLSYHGAEYTFDEAWMEHYRADDFGLVYVCGLEIEEPTGIHIIEYLEKYPHFQICYAPGPRGIRISPEKMERMMNLHPILHINEQEALELSGASDYEKAAVLLNCRTNNTVIITLGAQGAYYLEQNGCCSMVPSPKVDRVIDTIGAGDAHIGAVLACLTKDIPLQTAVAYANQAAAAVIQVKGALLPPDMVPSAAAPSSPVS